MHPIPAHILLVVLLFSSLAVAANFTHCLESFKNDPNATGGVDALGLPTSPAQAVGLTYKTCTERCGSGAESFNWREFAQLFSAWLLPWLALVSQLPFGSGNYLDDFISVVMNVGSPALGAYSLALTALNARSVYRRVKSMRHENKTIVARALIALQQVPLRLTKDERLLSLIPINDRWGHEIVDRLGRRNAWTVATATSVAWVVIAFVFTLIDSFVSLNDSTEDKAESHAIGTLWLWLLCLVIGWLWVPTFTYGELNSALHHANHKAAKKAAKSTRRAKASQAMDSAKAKITDKLPKGIHTLKGSRKPDTGPVIEVTEEDQEIKEELIQEDDRHRLHDPSTAHSQLTSENQHSPGHLAISISQTPHRSTISVVLSSGGHTDAQSSIHPETAKLLIPNDDLSSLSRDEFRNAATFNYARIMGYLALVDDILRALDNLAPETEERKEGPVSQVGAASPAEGVVFPPRALASMFTASLLALVLLCGTTGAAVVIIVFTPTIGLGCRSLGYIIYGANAVVIMFLTIASTVFTRIAETRGERSATVKDLTALTAIALRKISFLFALLNATGLMVLSSFHFSNFLDNCYCNASVTNRGTGSYIIIFFLDWISTMRIARIVGTALAAVSMSIYMLFIWFVSALPAEIVEIA